MDKERLAIIQIFRINFAIKIFPNSVSHVKDPTGYQDLINIST